MSGTANGIHARGALRWGLCLGAVLMVHGAALVALRQMTANDMPPPPPEPIMLDLSPEPQAPPAAAPPVPAPEPPQAVEPPPVTPPPDPPPEPAPPDPTPPPPPAPEPVVIPPTPPTPAPEAVLPPPPPLPVPPVAPATPPPPKVLPKPPQPWPIRHVAPPPKPEAPVTVAPAPPVPAPPAPPAAPSVSPQVTASWQGQLIAHIQRFKRYPLAAQRRGDQGVAYVRFVMDRNGNVLSATLARSSGHADLDEEATAWLERAQPLPKPPPEIAKDRMELVLPMRFEL